MALQEAPDSIDITDIQFKVHSKYQLFNINASTPNFNGIDLLATASTFGLLIVGKPSAQEIQVLQLKDVVANKESSSVPVRTIKIPGEPYILALSCDHTMLSVCYTANGMTFMDVLAVQSFLSNNVSCILSKIMVSNTAKVKQILWNPVIPNTMAVCLSDGTLGAYVIKANSYEFNSLDKSENARCACWSPKGKQIVVAFPNGKLAQYKPDLKLAKAIPCAARLFDVSFTPIAVQWLSTYQFAVVFVEDKEDATQSLFIVNAPKTAPPTYINYYDITYSQTGPRAPQVFLIHILQWNLLLMASSNGTEIGILGTTETGETPLWKQYTFIDEGRAELPLTADKQDTFPIGLALETGCTHQVTIGENQIPVMPMLHILSTHGFLLSFNLLNFQPNRVDICSPPQNLPDQSGLGLFRPSAVDAKPPTAAQVPPQSAQPLPNVLKTPSAASNEFHSNNLTFSITPETGATSTPAKPSLLQAKPTFGLPTADTPQQKPAMTNLFGGASTGGFGSSGFGLGGSKEVAKPFAAAATVATAAAPAPMPAVPQNNVANVAKVSAEANKPFLTVQPNYKPASQASKSSAGGIVSNSENDAILRRLIKEEIEAFDAEIRAALARSKNIQINICGKEEISKLIKSIDEMQEITTQATESTESIKADVNSLRLTLYEMHAMMAEAQSKVEEFNKMGKSSDGNSAANQTHRRLINKLQNQLAQNQARFDVFSKQLDANWSAHLQNQRENDRARMRIPTLENVYQTLEQQHQILLKEKAKINKIKAKIGVRESSPHKIKYSYSNTDNIKMNSLVDSVLSLTIGDQIKNERKALSAPKLNALRKFTVSNRSVNLIKPSRPDRKGLNSEIIIEKKLANAKAQKEKENLKKAELEAERVRQEELAKQKELAKPKPLLATPPAQQANVSLVAKPKDVVDKQTPTAVKPTTTTATPTSSFGSSLFGSLATPNFGSPQITTTPLTKTNETKPIFGGGEKTQSPFTAEKPAPKPTEPVLNLNTGLSGSGLGKAAPFDKASSTTSGFSFGAKTEPANVSTSTPSTGAFSFGASTKAPSFGAPLVTTQTKSGALNLAKPATPAANEAKPSLLQTPKTTAKEAAPTTTPVATAGFNATAKPAGKPAPLLATPNIPPQLPSIANPSNAFKFDVRTDFSSASVDKSKLDKENSPIVASVSVAKSPSIGNFSFLSASSSVSSTPTKPSTPVATAAQPSPVTLSATATPVSTQTSTPASVATPSAIRFSFAKASAESPFGASTATTSVTATTPSATVSSSADASSIFKGFNVCKPNVAENDNAGKSLFSSNSFGSLGNATSPASTASIFGATAQTPSSSAQTSIFGGKSIATSTPPTTSTTTVFGVKSPDTSAAQPASGGNIFGAKSVESASLSFGGFGLGSTTPAASTATSPAATGNIFGGAVAAKPASNIFGGAGANATSNTSTASIFGGAATPSSPSNAFGSSVFGTPNNSASVFGGVATSTATSPTAGSIFGGASPNPSSGGSIFGGSASFSSPQQPSTFGASTFGGGSSGGAFGAQTSNAATSPSAFGGGSFSQAASNAPAFGAQPTFGSPFGQANQQQTAFGSPQQPQQQSGFGLSAIAAQSNPTFGSTATFGAAPTFGSPKSGFGTFANVNTNQTFATPQKNSLFESLGSSENAMTFGNLAHQSPTNAAAAPKPFSGGSSFSSWR